MDLLEEYSSSSSSDEGSKDDGRNGRPPHPKAERKAVSQASLSPKIEKAPMMGQVRLIESSSEEATDLFVREIPHTRGNWAGHVFCTVSTSSCLQERATSSVTAFCNRLQHAGYTGAVLSHTSNLHVSLSRPFFLQQSFLESFVKSLRQRLLLVRSTRLVVIGEKVLVNDGNTRSFWCWTLSANPSMHQILQQIDQVLQEYQQDTYYESPEFHVSLASLPGNAEEFLAPRHQQHEDTKTSQAATIQEDASTFIFKAMADGGGDNDDDDDVEPIIVSIDHVSITFGTTKHYGIDLKP